MSEEIQKLLDPYPLIRTLHVEITAPFSVRIIAFNRQWLTTRLMLNVYGILQCSYNEALEEKDKAFLVDLNLNLSDIKNILEKLNTLLPQVLFKALIDPGDGYVTLTQSGEFEFTTLFTENCEHNPNHPSNFEKP